MFRYSIDEFIASKQHVRDDKMLDEICQHVQLEYSPDLEQMFDGMTFSFLEEFTSTTRALHEHIVIPVIPRYSSSFSVKMDLKVGFDKLGKAWSDHIPYIEHSFPEDYRNPHGPRFQDCYFFFFTQYHDFEASQECVKHYLQRLSKLKAFL